MKVMLIRHFKVDFKWGSFYNSEEYESACGDYNTSPVLLSTTEIRSTDRLITSTMARALETSKYIFRREPDLSDSNLCEVPIKPFTKTKIRFPKIVWDILGRLQWRFNFGNQPESYTQSRKRVEGFVKSLIGDGQNVVIVCHGWIMKLMIRELRLHGFKGPNPIFIKNGFPYEFTRAKKSIN